MTTNDGITTEHNFDGYKLFFHNKDGSLDPQVQQRMIQTFETVYHQIVRRFNSDSSRTVHFTVDPEYRDNPAATSGNNIIFSATWLREHPADTDVVTHELMHVVQAYPSGGPGWLVEGIADYVRNRYGINNGPGGWSMQDYSPGENYENGYRVTARFLTWLENRIRPSIVNDLDAQLRQQTYGTDTWHQLTGKTVNELWNQYAGDPSLNNVEPRTEITSGSIYKLININSGKALDVTQSGTNNGTNVQIFQDNNTDAQKWRIQDTGNDTYKLISMLSDKVLDVSQSGTVDGTNVQIWDDNDSLAQRWYLQTIDNGQMYKVLNAISRKALDVDHSGTNNGANVQIWADNGTRAQQWRLHRLS